jgi:leader peptidase (prepilin peptidase)/N-methyltransferase
VNPVIRAELRKEPRTVNVSTLPVVLGALSLSGAAVVAFAYAWFIATWVSTRVEPTVPLVRPIVAGTASAALAVILGFATGVQPAHIIIAGLAPLLILSAYVDSKTKRIPNAYVIHGLSLIPVTAVWLLVSQGHAERWWVALLWSLGIAFATFCGLLVLNIVSRGGLGMGDVKLGAVLTFFLTTITTFSWPNEVLSGPVAGVLVPLLMSLVVLAWLTLAFLGGAVWLIVRGKLRSKTGFPFGPFLVLGFAIVLAVTPLIGAAVAAI